MLHIGLQLLRQLKRKGTRNSFPILIQKPEKLNWSESDIKIKVNENWTKILI